MFMNKKHLLNLLSLIIIALSPITAVKASEKSDSTCIAFDSLTVNVGNVYMDAPKQMYHIEYTNTGNAELKIIRISTDCDCTEVAMPEQPLKSGERATLNVSLDMSRFPMPGPFRKKICIVSDASAEPVILTLIGYLKRPVN